MEGTWLLHLPGKGKRNAGNLPVHTRLTVSDLRRIANRLRGARRGMSGLKTELFTTRQGIW